MALDTQQTNVIESLVQGCGGLMANDEFLRAVQDLINDAELTTTPPTVQDLLDAGYWFDASQIADALAAIAAVRAVIEDPVNRKALNTLRKGI